MARAVLLDLGGVVLDIDFHRVFNFWAARSGTPPSVFYKRWSLDDAYKEHEVGLISFSEYCQHLGQELDVTLSEKDWRIGWNSLWVGTYPTVVELLPQIASQYILCAFSNTNSTHSDSFKLQFPKALSHFKNLYLSQELGQRKPNPEAFLKVCEHMGQCAEEVIFLDDTLENIEGAATAGLIARHTKSEMEVAEQLKKLLGQ
jgi:putative hydrolase of the HAD superfamily